MQDRKNNDLKKFLKKSVQVLLTLVILDLLIGGIFKHFYFTQKTGYLYRTTFAIDSTKANLLVLGSSRAYRHYVPAIFENKLHTTFYTCGRDHCGLIYNAAIISAILKRVIPKYVIIDINLNELSDNEQDALLPLLPYRDNPVIYRYITYYGKFEKYKLISGMYAYNSTFNTILSAHLSHGELGLTDDKGYVKLINRMAFHPKNAFNKKKIIYSRVKILDDLVNNLTQRHILVTLVISPSYYTFTGEDPMVPVIKELLHKNKNFRFFNYENDTAFNGPALFSSDLHLNEIGANKFSEDLANKLVTNN